mmetsp:Transcript_23078/g.37059  ORF Transcript_23078/g.37059 Transcript_23078/m.37059 type:complete len:225 (-) Transcript_23078:394-1068(-)
MRCRWRWRWGRGGRKGRGNALGGDGSLVFEGGGFGSKIDGGFLGNSGLNLECGSGGFGGDGGYLCGGGNDDSCGSSGSVRFEGCQYCAVDARNGREQRGCILCGGFDGDASGREGGQGGHDSGLIDFHGTQENFHEVLGVCEKVAAARDGDVTGITGADSGDIKSHLEIGVAASGCGVGGDKVCLHLGYVDSSDGGVGEELSFPLGTHVCHTSQHRVTGIFCLG